MPTALYQLELDQSTVNCGMSYVIQLKDGRFFIIDGGYFTPGEEDRLFNFLSERATGTPVIAAWFFTHAHQDHVGNFIQFVWKYRSSVVIEKLMYNFHPVDLTNVEGDWKSSDPATIKEFYRTVETYCSDIETITPRTGDTLTFDELQIEVIYTFEDLYPEKASFNDYSTVIKTTVGDTTILWLADAGAKASAVMLKKPEILECDIVQIPHHGIDDYPILCDLYAAIPAKVALWPAPDYGMVERIDRRSNQFVQREMGIQEHFASGYGTVKLNLPYSQGSAEKSAKACSSEKQPENADLFLKEFGKASAFRYFTSAEKGSN